MQGELTGQRLGNYRLDGVLGRGGMGVVYRAEQVSLGRPVAVKVIAPELSQDPMLRDRFKQEARLAASLDHPNVLPIYEADEAAGLLYIAMRYVDGLDLGQLIRERGRLHPGHAAAAVMQVASALDAAHSRGLVHRDVKPANVLLAPGADIAYLTDFGLTKHVGAASGPTQSGQFVGTPDYAAPEQIRGERVNAASDVYALGCVLHQALTGSVPFPRESNVAKMFAHINDVPPRPSDVADGIAPGLDAVVMRALAKDPAARFPSAGDLGRAAVAAEAHRRAPSDEHSVAVGDAALTRPAPPRPAPPPSRAATQPAAPPSAATAALPPYVPTRAPRRRSLSGAAVAAVAALVLLAAGGAAALVLGGGNGGGGAATARSGGHATVAGSAAGTTGGTGATTPSAPRADGRLPAETDAQMTADATSLLRRFYGAQIGKDYVTASQLTTGRYQRTRINPDYGKWVTDQQTGTLWFRGAQDIRVRIVDRDPADGSLTLYMSGMRYTQPGSKCKSWEGVTWVRYERGGWRYDPAVDATNARRAEWAPRHGEVVGAGCIVYR